MKIAIAGYGAEGESNYRYWNTPDNQVVIIDERQPSRDVPVDASVIVGEDAFSKLQGYDMVIRTAGLAPRKIQTDGKVWSATNEFFAKCPAPIIGVTGTKGKGTTCSLIANILRASSKTVHLVGNIGIPALDSLADITAEDIVVYELSSFQLWDAEKSPHIAVVLMIEPDHLDVHASFDEYVQAKGAITRYQTDKDIIVYQSANATSNTIASSSRARRVAIQSMEAAHVKEGYFWYGEQKICPVSTLQLPGLHNQDNACAAIAATWTLTQDIVAIQQGIAAFTGLPHRLKFVREVGSVSYYDDSIATTPGSAIAAIRAFKVPKVLILGGSDKGADYTELVDEIMRSDSLRAIVTVGQTGRALKALLQTKGVEQLVNHVDSTDMYDFVKVAAACAQPGDVVVLSPASASFDMFKNYSDRGDQFIAAVAAIEEA